LTHLIWIIPLTLLIILAVGSKRSADRTSGSPRKVAKGEASNSTAFTLRGGEWVEADAAFDAWTSQDLEKLQQAVSLKTNSVDRHFVLMGLVAETYRRRQDPEMAALCASTAETHIREFPTLMGPLKDSLDGILPRVPTFQQYATLLTEQGDFERAKEVCRQAIEFGLLDGTKSGFEGRIKRIEKKELGVL